MKVWTDTEQSWDSAQLCFIQQLRPVLQLGAEISWSAEQPSSGVVCAQLRAKRSKELIPWRQITSTLLLHKKACLWECSRGLVSFGLFGCEWHNQVQDELQEVFAESPIPFSTLVPPFCSATFPCGKQAVPGSGMGTEGWDERTETSPRGLLQTELQQIKKPAFKSLPGKAPPHLEAPWGRDCPSVLSNSHLYKPHCTTTSIKFPIIQRMCFYSCLQPWETNPETPNPLHSNSMTC